MLTNDHGGGLQTLAGPPGQLRMEAPFAEPMPTGREVQLPTAAKPHSAICKYFHSPKVLIIAYLALVRLLMSTDMQPFWMYGAYVLCTSASSIMQICLTALFKAMPFRTLVLGAFSSLQSAIIDHLSAYQSVSNVVWGRRGVQEGSHVASST